MPITQDRFIAVLDGAEVLCTTQLAATQALRTAGAVMESAYVARETSDADAMRFAIGQLLALLTDVKATLENAMTQHLQLTATVLAEAKHFKHARGANMRAREKMRAKRTLALPAGSSEPQARTSLAARSADAEPTANWEPNWEAYANTGAAGAANLSPAPSVSASGSGGTYDKRILSTSKPSLAELNSTGTVAVGETVL